MREEEIGRALLDAAYRVHTALGPGLLEGAYELCLVHELQKAGLSVCRQVVLPLQYDGVEIESAFRIDVIVGNCVIAELKSIETILPVHRAQLLSYLRLGGFKLGFLLNFHVAHMKQGVVRLVNGL